MKIVKSLEESGILINNYKWSRRTKKQVFGMLFGIRC